MNALKGFSVLVSLLVASAASIGSATTIYDNLSEASAGEDTVFGTGPLYDSFSTSAAPTLLTNVKLLLSRVDPAAGSSTVALFSDSSTSPGTQLTTIGSISDATLTSTPTAIDVALVTPYALAGNTRYWIGVSTTNGAVAKWSFAGSDAGVGTAGEYYANTYLGTLAVYSNTDGPYQMSVQVSSVPEIDPSGLSAALAIVTGAVGLLERRRLKRS